MTRPAAEVRTHLAALTGTDAADWYVVFKARYGMLETFSALAATHPRRTVVTQLLTCSTAVDPILVAGMAPAYAEVSPASLAIDPDRLDVGADTAAVVIQHTFGIIDGKRAQSIARAAREAGAAVCEDSSHCAGRMARDPEGLPLADVSFHSFGVEKMLPTKFGGAVWVNPAMADRPLRDAIVARLVALKAPGLRLRCAARTYRYQLALLNRLPRGVAARLRPMLVESGIFTPAVAPSESEGRLAHGAFAASPWVAARVAAALVDLPAIEANRTLAVAAYADELGDLVEVPALVSAGQPLARFPFLAPPDIDADAVIGHLRAQGIVAGTWYRPALFPGAVDPEVYGYRQGDAAHAGTEDIIARIVNLPTNVGPERARQIARQALAFIDSSRAART